MLIVPHRQNGRKLVRRFAAPELLVAAVIAGVVPLAADRAQALPWFQSLFDIYPGGSGYAMVAVDFDRNGRTDLVTSKGAVFIHFNDGTWFAGPALPGGFSNQEIATGDFNQDGWPDVAGAFSDSRNANQLNVYLNLHGTGFDTPLRYPVPREPEELVVADFNGDGMSDAVTLHRRSAQDTVFVWWGAPGGFGTSLALPLPWLEPYHAVAADFNEDSYADLAVIFATHSSVLAVYPGGPGGFGTRQDIPLPIGTALACGDVNGDGHADLVVDGSSTLLGDGQGQFSILSNVSSGFGGMPSLADVDGDGILDLIGTGYGATIGYIVVLPGVGDGTFGAGSVHSIQNRPYDTWVADFNEDGLNDMAAVVGSGLGVLTGNPDGGLNKVPAYSLPAPVTEVFTLDWNRDGVEDLLAVSAGARTVSILPGLGGDFGAWQTYPLGFVPGGAIVTDLNGDGILDFAAADGLTNSVRVFLCDAQGNLPPAGTIYAAGNYPTDLDAGDFNNDGIPDLVVTNYGYPGWSVSYLQGAGGGIFQPPLDMSVAPTPASIRVADFNSDGALDFVTAHPTARFSVVLGRGDGTFNSPTIYNMSSSTGFTLPVDVADMNNDGILDIVSGNGDRASLFYRAGTGRGTFDASGSLSISARAKNIALADLNKDGYLDVLSEGSMNATAGVRFGTGTGYRDIEHYGVGPAPAWALPIHFDAGPEPELAVFDDSLTVMILRHVENPRSSVPGDPVGAGRLTPLRILANPAHGVARFLLNAPPEAEFSLSVFDAQGRLVRVLPSPRSSATAEFVWRGDRDGGARACDGFYIACVAGRSGRWTLPFIWLK